VSEFHDAQDLARRCVVLFDWLMSVDLNAVPVEHP
jgi:hypothetical protein